MRKFVQPNRLKKRPPKRVIIRTEAKKTASWKVFLYFYWKAILGVIVVLGAGYLFFFYNWMPIQHVVFTQETENQLDYEPLYESITTGLVGQGYIKQKWRNWGGRVINTRREFPIIRNITIVSFENGTLTLEVEYNHPDFIMYTENKTARSVYRDTLLPYNSGALLGSTGIHLNIALPEEMTQQFSGGIFWAVGSQTIARTIKQINFLTGLSVTYYPGWEKLAFKHGKDTFTISLEQKNLTKTFEIRKRVLPYLPTELPTQVDLSNPDNTIITY